jgi:hypothetical protein
MSSNKRKSLAKLSSHFNLYGHAESCNNESNRIVQKQSKLCHQTHKEAATASYKTFQNSFFLFIYLFNGYETRDAHQ